MTNNNIYLFMTKYYLVRSSLDNVFRPSSALKGTADNELLPKSREFKVFVMELKKKFK